MSAPFSVLSQRQGLLACHVHKQYISVFRRHPQILFLKVVAPSAVFEPLSDNSEIRLPGFESPTRCPDGLLLDLRPSSRPDILRLHHSLWRKGVESSPGHPVFSFDSAGGAARASSTVQSIVEMLDLRPD